MPPVNAMGFNQTNQQTHPPSLTLRCIKIISKTAFIVFAAFACYLCPGTWTLGFGVGLFFRYEIKTKVTELFGKIMWTHLSWQLVIPATGLMYWFLLPNIIVLQAFLAGAAFGSTLVLTAEELLNSQASKNIINLLLRV